MDAAAARRELTAPCDRGAWAAHVSVYAQFACGMLLFVGALTRWAALVMIVNFIVALVGVHRGLPFRTFLEPCAMLACSIALFIGGPGRVSVDAWLRAPRGIGAK